VQARQVHKIYDTLLTSHYDFNVLIDNNLLVLHRLSMLFIATESQGHNINIIRYSWSLAHCRACFIYFYLPTRLTRPSALLRCFWTDH